MAALAQDGLLTGPVVHVVDGDTFDLLLDRHPRAGGDLPPPGTTVRIRLWGIDAPDRGEPGRDAATVFLADLVAGRRLACEIPPTGQDRDRYGRYVRLCRLSSTGIEDLDGEDLAARLVSSGHAEDWPRFSGGRYSALRAP